MRRIRRNWNHEARPLRADAERNRRRLLDAARDLLRARTRRRRRRDRRARRRRARHAVSQLPVQGAPDRRDRRRADEARPSRAAGRRSRRPIPARRCSSCSNRRSDQQTDRALFEAVDDTLLANHEIGAAYTELMAVLDALVAARPGGRRGPRRRRRARHDDDGQGRVRGRAARSSRSTRTSRPRQLDLVRAAISTPGAQRPPPRPPPTIEDLERAHALPVEREAPHVATG